MKKVILVSILALLIQSCANLNFGNFNKQKFTHLKVKKSKSGILIEDKNVVNNHKEQQQKDSIIVKSIEYSIVNQNKVSSSDLSSVNISETGIRIEKIKKEIKVLKEKFEDTKKEYRNSSELTNLSVLKHHFKMNGLYYFLILLGIPFLSKRFSYKISKWSNQNIKKAQLLIGLFSTTGIISSYLLGNLFDFNISKSMFIIPLVLGAGSLIITKLRTRKQYFKNKLGISMLSTSTLFMFFSAGSHSNYQLLNLKSEMAVHPILAVLLTIIIIALLAASIYGLAIIACELSCAGYELLAGIIFFGGSTGLIFLVVLAIGKLFGIKRKKKKEKDKPKKKKDITTILLMIAIALLVLILIL